MRPNHVVIEGPDGAGKTTLAQTLVKQFGLKYHHEGPPPADKDGFKYYTRLMLDAEQATVFDRLHYGELVYGPLLRGASRLTPEHMYLLHEMIVAQGTLVVFCLPPIATCTANLHKNELIKDPKLLERAYDHWTKIINHCSKFPNEMMLDYTVSGDVLDLPIYPRLPNGCTGSPFGKILLVGEKSNSDLDLAFYGWQVGHSSHYLRSAVQEAGFADSERAFVNAVKLDGTATDLTAVVDAMPNLTVVAPLGKLAEQACILQLRDRVKLFPVPHPSYWRRFKWDCRDDYVRFMKEARDAASQVA